MPKEKKVLDKNVKINVIELEPREEIPFHVHKDTKYNYILKGSMMNQDKECCKGEIVENMKGSGHSIKAGPDGCEFLVIWS